MSAAPVLNILKDGEQVGSQRIEGEVMLGRAENCVIRLEDRAISRQHAVFRVVSGGVQVERKSEFAPLSVNGSECTRALVKEGDVVSIGPYLLRLAAPAAPTPIPAASSKPGAAASALDPDPIEAPGGATVALSPMDAGEGFALGSGLEDPGAINLQDVSESPAPDSEAGSGGLELNIAGEGSGGAGLPVAELQVEAPAPVEMIGEDSVTRIAAPGGIKASLTLAPDVANVTSLPLGDAEIAIGRGSECEIVLNTKKASRKHAVIRPDGGRYKLVDLGSANGTYLNGHRIQEADLSGDDEIRIGGLEIRFRASSSEYQQRQAEFMKADEPTAPLPQHGEEVPEFQLGAYENAVSSGPAEIRIDEAMAGIPASASGAVPFQSSAYGGAGLGQSPTQANIMGLPPAGSSKAGAVPGIPSPGTVSGKKQSLIEKYRALPPARKLIWTVIVLAVFYYAFIEEDEVTQVVAPKKVVTQKKDGAQGVTGGSGVKAGATGFDALSDKDKAFVEAQHTLGFDHYKNKEYDKAIYELSKIFALIPDYKDSREIERYAKEGQRKLQALEDEKRKREEEARLKARVAQLVDEATDRMKNKQYDQAQQLFYEILAVEPDNAKVSGWKKQIEDYEEEKQRKETERKVQEQINARAWAVLKEGLDLKKAGHCRTAVPIFQSVKDVGASDARVVQRANLAIKQCRASVIRARDPVLASARQAESQGELRKAFSLYRQATQIDPGHPEGYKAMARIRGVLRDRAKVAYAEGVMAESYSDFAVARKKYHEVLGIAPEDDLYYERAQRKLSGYLAGAGGDDAAGSGPAPAGSAMPATGQSPAADAPSAAPAPDAAPPSVAPEPSSPPAGGNG